MANEFVIRKGLKILEAGGGSNSDSLLVLDSNNNVLSSSFSITDLNTGGTVTEVSSATTNQLTISNPTTTPTLSIITGAVTNGGTGLATGDQIHSFVTSQGYITGNENITLSGDISGNGTTSITSTAQPSLITGKTALTSGLTSTDEFLINDGGSLKRMDVSVLETYMQNNLSFTNNTNTIYDLSVLSGGSNDSIIRLSGSDGVNNDVTLSGTSNEIRITEASDTITFGLPDDVTINNSLTVEGTLTAREFNTEFVSSSIIFESGSTKFGDSSNDTHDFTGSVNIDGDVSASAFIGNGSQLTNIDADTLDGNNGSFYLNYNNFTNTPNISNDSIEIIAGNSLTGGGSFTLNGSTSTITINHEDTSTQSSVNNSGTTVIQDVTLDTFGHITGLASIDLSNSFDNYGFFTVTDGSTSTDISSNDTLTFSEGTNVTIGESNGTITISATDTNTQYTAGDGLNLAGTEFSVDSTVVRTTGNQTIGGTKTFSNTVVTKDGVNVSSGNEISPLRTSNQVSLSNTYEDIVTLEKVSAGWFDYYVFDTNGNSRTGTVMATQNNTGTIDYTDTSVDLGNSLDVEFRVVTDGATGLKLQGIDPDSVFDVRVFARGI